MYERNETLFTLNIHISSVHFRRRVNRLKLSGITVKFNNNEEGRMDLKTTWQRFRIGMIALFLERLALGLRSQ